MNETPKPLERTPHLEIEKGCLVKLDIREVSLHDVNALAQEGIHPDIAYRVLAIDKMGSTDRTFTKLAWLGENKFTQAEIDSFDTTISLDIEDKEMSIYDDVVPIPLEYLHRLLD